MTCKVIATGSKGNAVLVDGGIMVDCGVPLSKVERYLPGLKLILLTHVHGDHFKPSTVREICRRRPGIRWGCCEWMVGPLLQAGARERQIDVYQPGRTALYMPPGPRADLMSASLPPGLEITPYPLTHDVPNCGYLIETPEGSAFYATDTATLDGIEVRADLYLIEANYVTEELQQRIREKEAAGEYVYEYRAANNHLSEEQAVDWLMRNMPPGAEYLFLHRHEEGSHAAEDE